MSWTVLFVSSTAAAELAALPVDMRARFERIVKLILAHARADAFE